MIRYLKSGRPSTIWNSERAVSSESTPRRARARSAGSIPYSLALCNPRTLRGRFALAVRPASGVEECHAHQVLPPRLYTWDVHRRVRAPQPRSVIAPLRWRLVPSTGRSSAAVNHRSDGNAACRMTRPASSSESRRREMRAAIQLLRRREERWIRALAATDARRGQIDGESHQVSRYAPQSSWLRAGTRAG